MKDDPRYRKGIELFNNQDFFEAHEVWEDLWHETRGEPRDFVQGLIQVTSSLHHLGNGNMRGARILHDSGIELLSPYGDRYAGLDLAALRRLFDGALEGILAEPLDRLAGRAGTGGPVKIAVRPERFFKLTIDG